MKLESKQRLVVAVCVGVILASCTWIYFTQVREAKYNVELHQHIGEVLADHASGLLGKKGQLVIIAIDTKEWPELKTQVDAFRAKMKKLGDFEIREYELDTKDQDKYGLGSGLSGRRYVRTVNKNTNANLFVSFVGAPKLSKEEVAELVGKPRLIVESRSGDNVPDLFERNLVEVAVVSRFQFPAPGPEKPGAAAEWFVKRYQVLTPDVAAKL